MATFNPYFDTQDPHYLSLSKPIGNIPDVKADTSLGTALSGLGNVIGTGLHNADAAATAVLKDQLYDSLDKVRQERIDTLQAAKDEMGGAKLAAVGTNDPAQTQVTRPNPEEVTADATPGKPLNIIPQGQSLLPRDLSQMTETLGVLNDARANGKLSMSAYEGRLDAVAKDFRSRFPGYREIIDHEVERITGMNPANAMVKSIMGDINAGIQNANKERDSTIAYIRHNAKDLGPNAAIILNAYMSGTIDTKTANSAVSEGMYNKWYMDTEKEKLALIHAQDVYRTTKANSVGVNNMNTIAVNAMNGFLIQTGAGMSDTVKNVMDQWSQGTKNISPEQFVALAEQGKQAKLNAYLAMREHLYTPYKEDPKRNLAMDIGKPEEVEKLMQEALKPFDMLIERFGVQNSGGAMYVANVTKAQKDVTVQTILKGVPALRIVNAVDALAPNYVAGVMTGIMGTKNFSLDKNQMDALDNSIKLLVNPPDLRLPLFTPSEAFKRSKEAGVMSPDYAATLANHIPTTITGGTERVPAPRSIQEGFAKATFNPLNDDYLQNFQMDHWEDDGKGGRRWVEGKTAIYQGLTTQKMVDSVYAMGPKYGENMKAWAVKSFDSLYREEIRNLSEFATTLPPERVKFLWDKDRSVLRLEINPNAYVPPPKPEARKVYDAEGKLIEKPAGSGNDLGFIPPSPMSPSTRVPEMSSSQVEMLRSFEFRINQGITGLVNIYRKEGKDPNEAILQYISQTGGGAIPQAFLNSILASAKPKDL